MGFLPLGHQGSPIVMTLLLLLVVSILPLILSNRLFTQGSGPTVLKPSAQKNGTVGVVDKGKPYKAGLCKHIQRKTGEYT